MVTVSLYDEVFDVVVKLSHLALSMSHQNGIGIQLECLFYRF